MTVPFLNPMAKTNASFRVRGAQFDFSENYMPNLKSLHEISQLGQFFSMWDFLHQSVKRTQRMH